MKRDESPLPPPASRLRRTLHSLRSPFRGGSPFHLSARRSGSGKSSASDGDLARDERTMRKRNKKTREPAPAPVAAADSRSTDSSPAPSGDKKKKEGFMRRMGSIGKKRTAEFTSTPSLQQSTKESSLESVSVPRSEPSSEPSTSKSPTPEVPVSTESTPELPNPETPPPKAPTPEPPAAAPPAPVPAVPSPAPPPEPKLVPEPSPDPVSHISVVHPVATRPFTKAAWQRKRSLEIPKPVEEPSPESALRRRIAFVSQASVWLSEEEGGRAVGSLEEAVALARERLGHGAPAAAAHARSSDTEEEACSDAMPAYGDLIEPTRRPAGEPSHASSSAERREHLYKILVIGELGTGKTSIIKRYVHQFFSQHYRATIGVDFALKVLNWDANTVIRLQLWDIAGQERFGNMTRVYYKEAVGAFIVFDVSRVATFDAVVKWKNDLDAKVQLPDGSPIPCVLLANKCDQQKEGLVNSAAKMEEYCREKGFAGWFETSAKENINIEEAARSLVNKILLNDKLLQSNDNRDGDKFALEHKIANGENSRDSNTKSCNC